MNIELIEEKNIDNNNLKLYKLENDYMSVEICTYGARINKILCKDIKNKKVDIICGFYDCEEFISRDNPYFNAVIGRVGNRIENSKFTLNNVEYNLYANNGKNSLHGGKEGFDHKFWDSEIVEDKLKLSYLSVDGEEGYPGNLQVDVYYSLSDKNELEIEYRYKSDKDTVVNLTNHAYFNLNGDFKFDVLNHFLWLNSDKFSGIDNQLIPLCEENVEDTPFDFRKIKQIGRDINLFDNKYLKYGNGYDHNFIFNTHNYDECVCRVFSPISQIEMKVYTDCPCVQLYTANSLDLIGRFHYKDHYAFCLETQKAPNLINTKNFEDAICKKDVEYVTKTKYVFNLVTSSAYNDGKILTEELIAYARKNLFMSSLDEVYFRNLLLTQLKLTDNPLLDDHICMDKIKNMSLPDELIETIEGYAIRNKLTDLSDASKFSSYIIGLLTPTPSKINNDFYAIREKYGIDVATNYFYNLCIKNNYIQKSAIDKNVKWSFANGDKKLEITINLSKPEKSNKDIAKAVKTTTNIYPKCPLCKENEGYYGSIKIQPRTNLRTISLKMGGEDWLVQYSPYAYFEEHCIALNKEHKKMEVDETTLSKMFDFIEVFPNYFIGSNASLPYIGGSILNHEHFQGGRHDMPMFSAKEKEVIIQDKYPSIKVSILDWYNSAIKLTGNNKEDLIACGNLFISGWKKYENKKLMIINSSDEIHNSLSPILRQNKGEYELYFIFRNNIQTKEYPEGYFHAHPEYHNIKREGIGLIEAMGLFILPGRLWYQLPLIEQILCKDIPYNSEDIENPNKELYYLNVHKNMIEDLLSTFSPETYEQAKNIVTKRICLVCENILLNTAVFKPENYDSFVNFVKKCLKKGR